MLWYMYTLVLYRTKANYLTYLLSYTVILSYLSPKTHVLKVWSPTYISTERVQNLQKVGPRRELDHCRQALKEILELWFPFSFFYFLDSME